MTEEIGIRELKENASEVLRRVREEHASYDVTYRGKVVARLVPADPKEFDQEEFGRLWKRMDELAKEVGKKWPKGLSAADAVAQDRR
ncbi:MAG: type II toxin-antitoxin system prevent-host-death family antitoxin [Chloroflexota bacterium]